MSPAAFPDWGAYIAALPGQPRNIDKAAFTSEGAGTFHDLWRIAGYPGIGVLAGNGTIYNRATLGAIPINTVTQSKALYLGRVHLGCGSIGTPILYDRLTCNNSLVGNTIGAQVFTVPLVPSRHTMGRGVQIWGEIYLAIGATASSMGVTYVNQSGVGGRVAVYQHPANAETVNQLVRFELQGGDTGVRSASQLQISLSTGALGSMGITLLRRIAEVPVTLAGGSQTLGPAELGLPWVDPEACMAAMIFCSTTAMSFMEGSLNLVEGEPIPLDSM